MPLAPEVDVVVLTFNTRDLTVEALRRLLDSDQRARLRLLVRDNASSDGTAAAIAAKVPEAELEAGEENVGFAAGVNRLLTRSTAPWVLLLNSDAWPDEGAIGRMVEGLEAQPGAAALAPRIERPDGTLEHSTHPFPSARVAAATAFAYHQVGRRWGDRLLLEGYWHHDRSRAVDWAVGAALLIRRAALDDVGPFDERFFMYAEDLEWCWRARERGWTIWFDPAARVVHVGNASGQQNYGDRRTRAYMRNTYRFYRAAHAGPATALYRALNLAGTARRYAVARARGQRPLAARVRRELPVHVLPAGEGDGPAAVGR